MCGLDIAYLRWLSPCAIAKLQWQPRATWSRDDSHLSSKLPQAGNSFPMLVCPNALNQQRYDQSSLSPLNQLSSCLWTTKGTKDAVWAIQHTLHATDSPLAPKWWLVHTNQKTRHDFEIIEFIHWLSCFFPWAKSSCNSNIHFKEVELMCNSSDIVWIWPYHLEGRNQTCFTQWTLR